MISLLSCLSHAEISPWATELWRLHLWYLSMEKTNLLLLRASPLVYDQDVTAFLDILFLFLATIRPWRFTIPLGQILASLPQFPSVKLLCQFHLLQRFDDQFVWCQLFRNEEWYTFLSEIQVRSFISQRNKQHFLVIILCSASHCNAQARLSVTDMSMLQSIRYS